MVGVFAFVEQPVVYPAYRRQKSSFSTLRLTQPYRSGNYRTRGNHNDIDHSVNESDANNEDYKEKLAELDQAIAKAEKEREEILRRELNRMSPTTTATRLGDIDDQGNIQRSEKDGLISIDDWKPKPWKQLPGSVPKDRISNRMMPSQSNIQSTGQKGQLPEPRSFSTRSKTSKTDAGTLIIDITPQGITTGTLLNGAFTAAWFSAIIPATLATAASLPATLLMLPFWAAGALVAKNGVVDPFISSKLSLGEYAWSIEKQFGGGRKSKGPTLQKRDGATDDLQGARVDVSAIVNDVPQFQLCLYSKTDGVMTIGLGLPEEELEEVAKEINNYLDGLQQQAENEKGASMIPWKTE